jgi:hypothetical protein
VALSAGVSESPLSQPGVLAQLPVVFESPAGSTPGSARVDVLRCTAPIGSPGVLLGHPSGILRVDVLQCTTPIGSSNVLLARGLRPLKSRKPRATESPGERISNAEGGPKPPDS